MKCKRDLFKNKKIKTMATKMVVSSQLSVIESKKTNSANKQNRSRVINMEIIWWVVSWERGGENEGKRCRD